MPTETLTQRAAWAGVPRSFYGRPSRESEPELQPPHLRGRRGQRGVLDRMMLHPRVGAAVQSMRVEVQQQGTVWTAFDVESREQVAFAEVLQAMCDRDLIVTDAREEGTGWSDVLGWMLDEWAYGFALANWSWPGGGDVLEVYPVMPSTVESWQRGSGPLCDEWIGVRQWTDYRSADIPRDALIYIRTRGGPGEWEGMSVLRPALFAFESWYAIARGMILAMQASSGVVDVSAPPSGVDSADWDALIQQLVEFEQGRRRWFAHEDGYQIDISFPASAATAGMVEGLTYWDAQLDQVMSRSMESLGFSSNGSRALGEELGEEARETRLASIRVLLKRAGRGIARVVADRVGYDGPLPRLEPLVERRREVSGRVQVLGSAVQAGLIRWTPEREQELASELDLAESEDREEAQTLLVGQLNAAVEIARQLSPPEGEQPIAPEVALELLIAAGITRESAERIVQAAKAGEVESDAIAETLSADTSMRATDAMASAAKRGLELRAEWGRGGTDTGVARARDISNRSNLSPDTWRRMKAFFDRHEGNRDAQKREDDGGPTAGWIAWLLWGGDPGRSLANAVVASMDAEQASACCDHHHAGGVKLGAMVQVEDADGETFEFARDLDEVERFVSWARNESIRLAADDDLQRAVNNAADAMRAALWAALPDEPGAIPASVDRVTSEYEDRFVAAVRAYAIRIADEVATQSAAERHRQVAPDGTRSYVMGDLAAIERKLGGQVEAMVTEAAAVMASRVRGRVVDHWMEGGTQAEFKPAQPRLFAEALPVGNLIESQGRLLEGYGEGPGEGTVPVEAIRTSVRDGARCGHCAARDLTRYDLTTREGVENMLAERLPDPECEGAPRCRCGWVLRYARVSGEEFARIQAEIGPALGVAA